MRSAVLEVSGFIGSIEHHAFFKDVFSHECLNGGTIPHTLFATFQMTFALMVPVLVTGAWAEKFRFSSACLFMIIWPVLVYYPTAHWIWGQGMMTNWGRPLHSRLLHRLCATQSPAATKGTSAPRTL